MAVSEILADRPEAAKARRTTPNAYLVLPATAPREQWLAARRTGIGSSDLPKLLELYGTPTRVYYDKLDMLPEQDVNDAMFWGTVHEDSVARVWAMRNKSAIRKVGIVAQIDAPHRMCTLDRRVTVCPLKRDGSVAERCALEVKTRNAFSPGNWKRHVPDDVLVQTLWQAIVTGYDHIHIAVLIGSSDYRQAVVRVAEHTDLVENITTIADRFWHDNVVRRVPPPSTGDPEDLIEVFDALHPARGGVVHVDRDLAAFEALNESLEAGLVEKDAKGRKEHAKAVMVGALGDAEIAVMGDEIAYTYKEVFRDSVDTALLAERWPDAYDACVTRNGSRRLDISNGFRKKWRSSE